MITASRQLPAGVVLAGGISARLGKDKAAIKLSEDNGIHSTDLLTRTASLLQDIVPRVLVSGRETDGFEYCPDLKPGFGPVAGIASALVHTGQACLALSCDLPFMRTDILNRLISAWRDRPKKALLTTFRHEDLNYPEMLVAVYEPEALPLLEQKLEQGLVKISRIIPPERIHFVTYSQKESLPFFNLNYPADLEAAKLIAQHFRNLL